MTACSPKENLSSKRGKKLLADLDYIVIKRLATRLDIPGDKNWRSLIEAMPSCRYDSLTVERFGMNASKTSGSPAYALLMDMSNRGITYDQLIAALKKMEFNLALHEIGYKESIRITQQPEATPGVEGEQLVLECVATGVPAPSFLWFKDPRVPLPDQTSSNLVIPRLSKQDAGRYCCRAQNEVNVVFSAWVEVKVQKPVNVPGSEDLTVCPKIVMQSPSEVTVLIGSELQLFVEASSGHRDKLFYQWFCNSKKLHYGTSNVLYVKHANLEDQGTYSCRVRSEHGGSCLSNDSHVLVLDPNQPVHVNPQPMQSPNIPMHMSAQISQQTPYSQQPPPSPVTQIHAPSPMTQMPPAMLQQISQTHVPSRNTPSPAYSHAQSQEERRYLQVDPNYSIPLHQIPPNAVDIPFDMVMGNNGVGYVEREVVVNRQLVPGYPNGGGYENEELMSHAHHYMAMGGGEGMGIAEPVTPIRMGGMEGCGEEAVRGNFPQHRLSQDAGYEANSNADAGCVAGGEGQPADLNDSCYDKVALLIGNKYYQRDRLKLNTPENDTQDMAGILLSAGFKVVSLVNLNKTEMAMALKYFESLIGKNVYAMFFFAGHGFEHNCKNYMMPVDADIEKNPDQCLCAQLVLQTMQARGAKLSIVILDMCRVNASSAGQPSAMDLLPVPQGSNGYFVIGFSCSPMERAFEVGDGRALREEDRDNSIFVSAFKRHLQDGSLKERLDTLLTDAAAGVRMRGKDFNTPLNSWMKPEIRHNLGEQLSLGDPIKNDHELDTLRRDRAILWQSAHNVPDSVVVGCQANDEYEVKPGELAIRLHFEAEHSNVLVVTAELLNGSLTTCEVLAMDMTLMAEKEKGFTLSLRCHEDNKQYKYKENTQFGYGHYQAMKEMDLMHFKIPDLQKIDTKMATLKILVDYRIEQRGVFSTKRRCEIRHEMSPPLYAKILSHVRDTPSTSPYVQPPTSYNFQQPNLYMHN